MMKKGKEFDNILDECLDRILKGETVEDCLASYPEHAAELEPLLRTSLDTKNALAIKPRPEFRERAGYQFRAALQEMEQKRERRLFFGLQPQWATAVIAVLVLMLASVSTVAAASGSMPDGPLYPVKLAAETVQLALTPSTLGKAELYAMLADKRVTEIVKMADKGKPEQVEKAAERLNTQLIAVANLAALPGEQSQVEVFKAPAPEPALQEAPAPRVEQERQEKDIGEVMAPVPEAAQRAPVAPGLTREGKGSSEEVKLSKRDKLREILARGALEHPEVLREALEKAPESVKSALRQAIAAADAGYRQALESLD
ncbi:DUF5667 domain-containing protein [Chloroflexota bacterium]